MGRQSDRQTDGRTDRPSRLWISCEISYQYVLIEGWWTMIIDFIQPDDFSHSEYALAAHHNVVLVQYLGQGNWIDWFFFPYFFLYIAYDCVCVLAHCWAKFCFHTIIISVRRRPLPYDWDEWFQSRSIFRSHSADFSVLFLYSAFCFHHAGSSWCWWWWWMMDDIGTGPNENNGNEFYGLIQTLHYRRPHQQP